MRRLRTIIRRFWTTLFTIIIALAVLVQLGRYSFPLIDDYREQISAYLGEKLNVRIHAESVQGTWEGLRPRLSLSNVIVNSQEGELIFRTESASAELSLVDSLLEWRLAWRHIGFENLKTSLRQDESGVWSIKGLEARSKLNDDKRSGSLQIKDPLDVFLFSRRVEIRNALFSLFHDSGKITTLTVPNIILENDDDFHRLVADVGVNEEDQAFSLIVEGRGDPRDETTFVANAHLNLKRFPMQTVRDIISPVSKESASSGKGDDAAVNEKQLSKASQEKNPLLDLSLWISGVPARGLALRGRLNADGLPLELPDTLLPLKNVKTEIDGVWNVKKNWQLNLKNFTLAWAEASTPPLELQFQGDNNGGFGLRASAINLGEWSQNIQKAKALNEKGDALVQALKPTGVIRELQISLAKRSVDGVALSAELDKVSVGAIKGSPEMHGISGQLVSTANKGTFTFDIDTGFSMHYPLLYAEPFSYQSAKGTMSWEFDWQKKILAIFSSPVALVNKNEKGVGQLHLQIPLKKDAIEPHMSLLIGLPQATANSQKKYLPKTLPKDLNQWIDTAVERGKLQDLQFLYHGSIGKAQSAPPNIQLSGKVDGGFLQFDPDWPSLQEMDGKMYLDGKRLSVEIESAKLQNVQLGRTRVKLVDDKKTKGQALQIDSIVSADASSAMEVLWDSPVKEYMSEEIKSWKFSGPLQSKLSLFVPINKDQSHARQKIEINLQGVDITLPEVELPLKKMKGKIYYNSSKGFYGDDIRGQLWKKGFAAQVLTEKNGKDDLLKVSFTGSADVPQLQTWLAYPELYFASGELQFSGDIRLHSDNDKAIEIDLFSTLEGLDLALPAPVGKTREQSRALALNILLDGKRSQYNLAYGKDLEFSYVSTDAASSAQLKFGEVSRSKDKQAGQFDIYGTLPALDAESWNDARNQYQEYLSRVTEEGESFFVDIDLRVGALLVDAYGPENVVIDGFADSEKWVFNLSSQMIKGRFTVFEADVPTIADIDYLHLPKDEEPLLAGNSEPSTKAAFIADESWAKQSLAVDSIFKDVTPDDFVDTDVSIKRLTYDGEDYGNWSFKIRPIENAVAVRNLVGDIRGMNIGSQEQGADMIWRKTEYEEHTQFSGYIDAENLATVLDNWEQDRILNSKSAVFFTELGWAGAPDQISMINLRGFLKLDVQNGSFVRGGDAGENPFLRMMALFNFDTIARRIRLDFSDLAKEGFAFDKVYGELDFDRGVVTLSEPLIVESSSSRMQLTGKIDTIDETLRTNLLVTLPVTGNLAVAAAFVSGLPAALGVYLVGKLFKRQVDKATSINFSVTGSWESPKYKVRKIVEAN